MVLSVPCRICTGALLTASVFILQVSCFLFPIFGAVMSAAGTMFVGAAGILLGRRAASIILCAALLLLFINPKLALEFLLTSGLTGGLLAVVKRPFWGLVVTSLSMFVGLSIVFVLFGSAAAGWSFNKLPLSTPLPIFAAFSPAYCLLCKFLLRRFINNAFIRHVTSGA